MPPQSPLPPGTRHEEVTCYGAVPSHGQQRGAASTLRMPKRVLYTQPPHQHGRALPNPSFKPSPNGVSRGPGWRYPVHFRHPGPRVTPLVPA